MATNASATESLTIDPLGSLPAVHDVLLLTPPQHFTGNLSRA